jgi:hypothetical protein
MNVNLVCKVGFKILAAVVAGAAIVIGIDKAVSGDRKPQATPRPNGGPEGNNTGETPAVGTGSGCLQQAPRDNQSKTDMILSGIRGAGETCGKLFTLAQSLSQMIQSVGSVFGNYRAPSNGVGGYPGQGNQTIRSGNIVWVPAANSSCILQAVPADNNNGW